MYMYMYMMAISTAPMTILSKKSYISILDVLLAYSTLPLAVYMYVGFNKVKENHCAERAETIGYLFKFDRTHEYFHGQHNNN